MHADHDGACSAACDPACTGRSWPAHAAASRHAVAQPHDRSRAASQRGLLGWMGKLLRLDEPTGRDQEAQYQRLLDQLQNSANILNQSEGLSVRWAGQDSVNHVAGDRTVRLAPDGLVGRDGTVDHACLEALTGRVYLASMLCSTVHPQAWKQGQAWRAGPDRVDRMAVPIWEALELRAARAALHSEWAGFRPALEAESRQGAAPQHEVQSMLDRSANAPHAEAAALGLCWNLLHPGDPVALPPAYASAIAAASKALAEDVPAARRARAAGRAAEILAERLGMLGAEPKAMPRTHDRSLLGAPMHVGDDDLSEQVPASEAPASASLPDVEGVGRPDGQIATDVDDRGLHARYAARRRALTPAIRRVLNSLRFNNSTAAYETYGHRTGDLDEGSLYKLFLRDDRVMSRLEVKARKCVAVGLLVDESGSMGNNDRQAKARDVAITLYEALRQVQGVELSIYGHTTTAAASDCRSVLHLKQYIRPGCEPRPASLMRIRKGYENLDSWAVLAVARRMLMDHPRQDRRLLFVISDGVPGGYRYGGKPAMDHMLRVVATCDTRGIEVYGIGVDNAFPPEHALALYGPGRCVVLDDVASSVPVITRFLRQVTRTM